MDASRAAVVITSAVKVATDFFYVSDWTLYWKLEHLERNRAGEIRAVPSYNQATMVINLERIKDEEHLWSVVGHELAHSAPGASFPAESAL